MGGGAAGVNELSGLGGRRAGEREDSSPPSLVDCPPDSPPDSPPGLVMRPQFSSSGWLEQADGLWALGEGGTAPW